MNLEALTEKEIRVGRILNLGLMSTTYPISDDFKDALHDDWEELEEVLGFEVGEDIEDYIHDELRDKNKLGWLIRFETPVPSFFGEDNQYTSLSWSHYKMQWIYSETLDGAIELALRWHKDFNKQCKDESN